MKVLVVTNMFPNDREPGFGPFVRDQIEDLRAEGLLVTTVAFDGRKNRANYGRAAADIRRMVHQERFDLIHAHHGLCGAAALAQRVVPIVTTFHGSETGFVRWQAVVSHAVARLTFPIFVSHHGASQLGVDNPVVIPAGVDTDVFRPIPRDEARDALGWQSDRAYVLFPASRGRTLKRFDLFEAVIDQARVHHPRLVGVSLECVPRERVVLMMNAADATLLTSDYEGSPVTVRESLACNTPVVAVPVGDVPRTLAGLPGCFVAPRQPSLLARSLLRAIGTERHDELRARAEQHSRQHVARRVIAVYGDVVDRSRRFDHPGSRAAPLLG